jgi:aminomethyltransferase
MLAEPLRTPLYDIHFGLQAQMGVVRGWSMPMTYGKPEDEYTNTTKIAGISDCSNQVKIEISGDGALAFLQKITTTNLEKLPPGRGCQTLLCRKCGCVLELAKILRFPDRFLLIGASGDAPMLYGWLQKHILPDVKLTNLTHSLAMLSLRGPAVLAALTDLTYPSYDAGVLSESRPQAEATPALQSEYEVAVALLGDTPVTVLRFGKSAQPRFDVLCAATDAFMLWHKLSPQPLERSPFAFGQIVAELMRVETGQPAFGAEITADSNPFECGLGNTVDFDKREFVGRQALKRCIKLGLDRQLVGIRETEAKEELRKGMLLFSDGRQVGEISSAAYSPRVRAGIALAQVDIDFSAAETSLDVHIPGRRIPVMVAALPFLH